jgi:serine protease Do
MTAGTSSLFALAWLLASGANPESYLGLRASLSAFAGEEEDEADPDLAPGLAVTSVVENSPAEAAGVQAGDVVLALNGEAVRTPAHLEALVAALPPGSELRLEVRRSDEVLLLSALTVPRLAPRAPAPPGRRVLERRRFGVVLEDLTAEEARAAGLAAGDGALVHRLLAGVEPSGDGLEPGDVVVALRGEAVHGPEDFVSLARRLEPGGRVEVVVVRGGARRTLRARVLTPESYVKRFHFPGVVIYERDPRKQATTFGLILNIFKYTRAEDVRTYRFLWFISFSTGTNEALEEVEE